MALGDVQRSRCRFPKRLVVSHEPVCVQRKDGRIRIPLRRIHGGPGECWAGRSGLRFAQNVLIRDMGQQLRGFGAETLRRHNNNSRRRDETLETANGLFEQRQVTRQGEHLFGDLRCRKRPKARARPARQDRRPASHQDPSASGVSPVLRRPECRGGKGALELPGREGPGMPDQSSSAIAVR